MDWTNWTPKRGDKVICIRTSITSSGSPGFVKGTVYTVSSINSDLRITMVKVYRDSNGRTNNGFALKNFRPATKAAQILYTTKE